VQPDERLERVRLLRERGRTPKQIARALGVRPATQESDAVEAARVLGLITHERQARDRGWWEVLQRCYTPEATIQSSWYDGTAARYIELSKQMHQQTP